MIDITKTDFAMYFEDLDEVKVCLLDRDESYEKWKKYLGTTNASYFKLEDNHWLVNTNPTFSERWIDDFNNETINSVKAYLDMEVSWEDQSMVYFCISKYLIIETTWSFFKNNWMNFIECEDDCPIVYNEKTN